MSNSFYNHGAFPSTGSAATSASMRAELDLISAGFDKMPTLSGNANKFVIINSTGTGMTQTDVLPAFTVTDTDFTVQDNGDNTRKFQFNAGSITTGNTRIYSMPDLDTTLVGTDVTQTLTNKTLTSPVIGTIVNTGTLTLPTSTDTLVGRNTTDTLTNKTLTNPVIGTIINTGTLTLPTSTDTLVGRQTTDTLTNKTISGASNTLSNIANGSLSNSSVVIGSSTLSLGGTLTTLAGVTISGASNTLSNIANASLTNSAITINGSSVSLGSSVTVTATATNALTIGNGLSGTSYNGSSAVTIAINTSVTADLSTAQTFSNKTISGSANTLSNIANASLTNSSITIGSTAISLGATSLTLAGLTSASATTLISTGNQATSVAISAIGHSSGTVTVTTGTAHGLTTNDVVSIDGVADYSFCGVYTVTVTNANVFTYSRTAASASSTGGYSTKLNGTWGLYAGGTGPSLANGPVMISASSQLPALRVTQSGNGYAFIVEDAANPDTSAFIISNAGDLAINTNKFTVASSSGNTLVAGTLDATGNFNVNTNKFSVVAASGNTSVAGTLDATGNFNVNTNKFSVVASSGNTTIAGTTSFGGNIVSNLLFTDATYDIGASGANRPRDLFLSRNLVVGGTLTLAGGVNLNGNVTIGDASSDTLTVNSTITSNLIFTNNTYDIGASGGLNQPRNLYLSGSTVITNTGIGTLVNVNSAGAWSSAYMDIASFYASGLTGGAVSLNVGKAAGTNNSGKIAFNYAGGSGSTNNYVELGLFNNDGLLKVLGTGVVSVPNTFAVGATAAIRGSTIYLKGTNYAQSSTQANLIVSTSTTQAADVGGSLGLGGQVGGDETPFAYISGRKENSISGNYQGYFAIATQNGAAGVVEGLRVASNQYVGLSVTNPQTRLDMSGVLRFTPNTADLNYSADIFASYDAAHPFQINVKNNGTTLEYMGVYAGSGGASPRVVFPNSDVGIKTTSPGGALEIFQTSTTVPNLRLRYNSSSYFADHILAPGGEYTIYSPPANGVTSGTILLRAGNDIRFATNNNAYSAPQMTLDTSGQLNLSTTSSKIVGGGSNSGRLVLANYDSTTYMIAYGSSYGSGQSSILSFVTNSSNTMTLDANGALVVGTTIPTTTFKTIAAGNSSNVGTMTQDVGYNDFGMGSNTYFNSTWKYVKTGECAALFRCYGYGGTFLWQRAVSGTANANITWTYPMTLDENANLTVNDSGGNQYSAKIYANGAIAARNSGVDGTFQNAFVAGYTSNYTERNLIQSAVSSASNGSGFRFQVSNGGGSSGVTTALDVLRSGINFYSGGSVIANIQSAGLFMSGAAYVYMEKSGTRSWTTGVNQTNANYVIASGDGLGTINLSCATTAVSGNLTKGSGSFKIDHPLPEKTDTHHLVHSFIEGPQADLIYRGKVNLVGGTATVNIDQAADMTEGTFVALCRDVQCFTTNESDWTAVRGSVAGNILTIEAQDSTSTASISWMVIGERQDKHMYDTGWTDDNGKVIVEPLKS